MKVNNTFNLIENEKLMVIKNDKIKGTINAKVQKNKVFTNSIDIPIERNDVLIRKLSNGIEEKYNVINPVYYNGFATLPPHYELEVSKVGIDDIKQSNNVYNINANKVNIDSTDNSLNITNDSEIFDKMLTIINSENVENKAEIISAINQMKENIGKPTFKDSVIGFMQIASNCIVLFKECLPLLISILK